MSKWNHRVVYADNVWAVEEVYYDDNGNPKGYGGAGILVAKDDETPEVTDPIPSLRRQLEQMLAALDKPILDAENDFIGGWFK